jgi:DNA polymerase-3 subunit alpha
MGQAHLFDMLGSDEPLGPISYPDAEDWPDFMQLKYEKEVLGLFISGHPLAMYSDRLRALSTANSAELNRFRDDESVVIGGIVSKIKTFVPKRKQERMAFVTLEDMDGFLEVVVFADLYSRTAELLHEDSLIVVAGRVSYRDAEPKVVAEEIVPFEEAEEQFARSSHIRLVTTGLEEDILEKLVEVVARNEGNCKLFVHCVTPEEREVIFESGAGRGLNPSPQAREQIEALTGQNTVWFSGRTDAVPACTPSDG